MSTDHDSDYKLLFSHPEMMVELLRDGIPGEWLADADFSTLERVNASYVSKDQKQRHDDMVWRLRVNDRWVWIYILLEFQSRPDPWMALRMLVYAGLMLEDLIRRGEVTDGRLPLLLPLVLYTGTSPWKVTTQVADLFPASPPALSAFIPRMAHYVIQKSHSGRDSSGTVRTVIDALFQLEHGRTPEDILRVVQGLAALLRDPENDELRRTFTLWVKHLLCRKTEIIPTIDITLENDTMLTEVIDKWAQ
ncbi:MAG: Rpn family recombination-promoting nuclease/putative transposase, partial [Candidatus Accumulibacter sp.]|nr:Rpn family recombination-promoting nuclease/putative transposase [Accumulibacter sp.]